MLFQVQERGSDEKCKSGNCQRIMELKAKKETGWVAHSHGKSEFQQRRDQDRGLQLEYTHFQSQQDEEPADWKELQVKLKQNQKRRCLKEQKKTTCFKWYLQAPDWEDWEPTLVVTKATHDPDWSSFIGEVGFERSVLKTS